MKFIIFRGFEYFKFENYRVNIKKFVFSFKDIGYWIEIIFESVDDFFLWTGE